MAKIKICGLRRKVDIDYVNELKPDYIGFILTEGFRRSIDISTAKLLKSNLDKDIKAVGVFVNDDIIKINDIVAQGIIDIVQLHGSEDADYCSKINAPVIKYFKPDMFDDIENYNTDFYLFDNGTGTGKSFDWSVLPKTNKPFFLAGGIDKDNIKKAINEIKPYCIDLSSSVETDGYKDYNKIKEIMEIMKYEQR
jgi:phosphoribosylanthranilate isomerase